MENEKVKPIKTIKNGNLKISIWKHKTEESEFVNCSVSKSWKNKNDEWENQSVFLNLDDLMKIKQMIPQTINEIVNL